MKKGLLIDITKCIGCGSCVDACKMQNDLPSTEPKKLDATNFTVVENHNGIYVRRLCMHCLDPSCASACPVSALYKTEYGAVAYDPKKCMGCRYCMVACPFGIPKYEWDNPNPKVRKCILCIDRLKEGEPTACAEACPTEATLFGEREELLKIAKERIQSAPDVYFNHIYGEKEAGGTSVLFLSPKPFEELGFNTFVYKKPYPEFTWAVMSKIPPFVLIWGSFLTGLWWLTERKNEVARIKKEDKK